MFQEVYGHGVEAVQNHSGELDTTFPHINAVPLMATDMTVYNKLLEKKK